MERMKKMFDSMAGKMGEKEKEKWLDKCLTFLEGHSPDMNRFAGCCPEMMEPFLNKMRDCCDERRREEEDGNEKKTERAKCCG